MSLPATLVLPDIVELPSGLKLEVHLDPPILSNEPRPESQRSAAKLAVCTHPWSRLGGSMDDRVLHSLVQPLSERLGFHVIRFNSRGVGRSSGWVSFSGFQEAEDLKELVAFATEKVGNVTEVALIGYSNGALPISLHPVLPAPIRTYHILISYPFGPRSYLTLFNSRTYQQKLEALLRDPHAHVLIFYGDQDEFTAIASYEGWANGLHNVVQQTIQGGAGSLGVDLTGTLEDRLKVVPVNGASHFWMGSAGRDMLHHIASFLDAS